MSSAQVRKVVLDLFQSGDAAIRESADASLRTFHESDLAWRVSQEFLCDADSNVQFFGAKTLCKKIQRAAQGYDAPVAVDLQALVPVIQRYVESATITQPSKQQLVLAMSAIAVSLCTTTWTTAVPDLLALAAQQPKFAWGALLTIPEELDRVCHNYLKKHARAMALLSSSQLLLTAALQYMPAAADEAPTGTLSDSEFSLAMQTLTQWSKVMGLPLVEHNGFSKQLVALIGSPAGNSEVLHDILLEVLRSSPGAFMIYKPEQKPAPALESILVAATKTMQSLLPRLMQYAESPAMSLEELEGRQLSRWAQVAGNIIEAYTQLLWLDRQTSEILLSFIAACFIVHPNISQSVFELWAILKDANRDEKLPHGVLSNMLQQLTVPCTSSFIRFGRYDSSFSEDQADLVQLRGSQQEIIVDMYCISAGTPEAPLFLNHLRAQLDSFEAVRDVVGMEVVWFAFSGVAEVLADEQSIPDVYNHVLQSIFRLRSGTGEQLSTAATLLRNLGPHFEERLQAHLAAAVQWLMSMVSHIPVEASDAVQELCGYAGRLLLPHVEEFLKVVVQVAPSVSCEVDAALHGGLVGITRSLPLDQAAIAFSNICESTACVFSSGLDVGNEVGREMLHRCLCRILRCASVMEEGGSVTSNPQGTDNSPSSSAQCAATCLARFMLANWVNIAPPCQKLLIAAPVARDAMKGKPIFEYSDVALQVNILALLRRAAKSATETVDCGPALGTRVVEFVVLCCKDGQLAPLCAAALIASSRDLATSSLLPVLDIISSVSLQRVHVGGTSDDLIPFLELCSSLASSVGDELFQSQHMPALAQLCVSALRSSEQDVLRPVLLFLQKLLVSRAVTLGEQDVTAICQAILLQFHTWPRSMNAQSFKVFSALAERHELVFFAAVAASKAVPALSALPAAEQLISQSAFEKLRGPRLRAFLNDIGTVARGENTSDVLQAYATDA